MFEENINDVEIGNIDFQWVEKQTKTNFLKRALKILELDGGYFPDLTIAIKDKLQKLDPKYKLLMENQEIDPETKKKAEEEILNFEAEMKKNAPKQKEALDKEAYQKEQLKIAQKKKAENEKNKGNEALKSNDFKEALNYYTKSLEFDPSLAASYCNRALVNLKLKKYKDVINDCENAIALDNNYVKAYHRRAQANFELKNFLVAVDDLEFVISKEPENKSIIKELNEAKKNLSTQDLETLNLRKNKKDQEKAESGFKRITIVEEEDDETKKYEDVLKIIEGRKAESAKIMKDGLFNDAIKLFNKNLIDIEKVIDENSAENIKEWIELKASNLSNISLCYMQLNESENVINFANLVLELEKYDIKKDILIKTYLRRALQYEKIDKGKLAKLDFLKVKELDPNNIQASQGLYRVNQYLPKEEVKAKPVIILSDELKRLEGMKEKGNEIFRKKNFNEAKQIFSDIITEIDSSFLSNPIFRTLYLQALNNRAFSYFNLTLYQEGKTDCDKILSLDPENVKALYRRSLCYVEIYKKMAPKNGELSTNLTELKNELHFNELAHIDMEKLLLIQKDNSTAREKLGEIIKYGIKLKMKIKELEAPAAAAKKEEKVEEKEKESRAKKVSEGKKSVQLNTGFLNEVTSAVVTNLIDDLINSKEIPNNSNLFEKDCKAFKNNLDKLFFYLKKISHKNFLALYSKKDLPTETFFFILEALKLTGIKEDSQFCLDLLNAITQINKFEMSLMFLTKKEKAKIEEILNAINDKLGDNETLKKLRNKFK